MTLLKRLFLFAASLPLLAGIAGCGGGKKASADATPPMVDFFTVQVEGEEAAVDFTIVDPTESEWTATIHFSEDLGQHWAPLSSASLLDTEILLSPPFQPVKRIWNCRNDLSSIPQADVILEVRIKDMNGEVVNSLQSDTISIGESEAPVYTSVEVPSGSLGGLISITGTVLDPDQDHLTLTMDWSPTGGDPWTPATMVNGPVVIPPASDGKPSDFEIIWDAQTDTPNTITPFAKFRLLLSDGGDTTTFVSSYLALNTVPPVIDLITIGDIPSYMNGLEPYQGGGSSLIPFMLTIPSAGSLIRLDWSPGNGGAAIDPQSLVLVADVPVFGNAPGVNLASLLTVSETSGEWLIPAEQNLPTGDLQLTATIQDIRGNISEIAEYSIHVGSGSNSVRPFDIEDRWFIDFSRDHFEIGFLDDGSGGIVPFAQNGGDGIPDHLQDLYTVGLQSSMDPGAANSLDDHVRGLVENQVIERIRILFEKTEISDLQPKISFQGTPFNYNSALGIGGDDTTVGSFALGRATFDARNQYYEDERVPGRGVFSSNMVQYYWGSGTFLSRFGALIPGYGTPVGTHPEDTVVLSQGFDRTNPSNSASANARFDTIWSAIDAWSRLISVVATHEIGHAIGLCTNGHPPLGLFGGVTSADFTGYFTTPYHVDTPGNNIMSSALGLTSALVEGPAGYRFNELNQAYIAEWIVLEN